jgi:hypothetical protein
MPHAVHQNEKPGELFDRRGRFRSQMKRRTTAATTTNLKEGTFGVALYARQAG